MFHRVWTHYSLWTLYWETRHNVKFYIREYSIYQIYFRRGSGGGGYSIGYQGCHISNYQTNLNRKPRTITNDYICEVNRTMCGKQQTHQSLSLSLKQLQILFLDKSASSVYIITEYTFVWLQALKFVMCIYTCQGHYMSIHHLHSVVWDGTCFVDIFNSPS